MHDPSRTKDLIDEISFLKQRIRELEKSESERKEASETIRKSEEYFKAIIRNSSDIILIVDKLGTITYASPSVERYLGYGPDELIGQRSLDLIVPDDKPKAIADFGKALLTKEVAIPNVFRVRHKYGTERVLEGIGKNLFDDPIVEGFVMNVRDVTDRKQVEEALRVSEEKYRLIAENTADLISILDMNLHFTYVSPASMRLRGFTAEEAMEQTLDQVLTPESMEIALRIFAEEMKLEASGTADPGRIRVLELEEYKKDGSIVWLENSLSMLRDKDQRAVGILSVTRDITDRKRAEHALRESEERFRTIFEQAAVGVAQVESRTGRFVRVNRKYCDIVGYSRKEMLSKRYQDITSPDDLNSNVSDVARLMAEEVSTFSTEKRYLRKNGSIVWVNLSVSPMWAEGQQPIFHIAVVEDINEHKRTEEGLRKSEENAMRLAKENATMAEIGRIVGATLNIDEVYEAFAEQVKKVLPFDRIVISIVRPEKNTTRNAYIAGEGILDRNTEDTYPLEGSGHAEMLRTKSTLLIQTEDFREYKDRFPGLWSTFQAGFRSMMNVPLFSKGEIIGALLLRSRKYPAYTERDVALVERIGAQIAGAIANAQLFNDLKKMEKSLRESEEHLRRAEKMEALGQLAGGVAHDLNNVLGIMSGYSELLLEEMPEGHRSRGHVEKILQSTEKGAAIIQDLLTLARRGVTASEVINLNSVVSGFQKAPVFEKLKDYHPSVTFSTKCDKNLLNIKGSPVHLEKTLMNLVSNAAESISGKGEVTIRTETLYLDKAIRGYDEVKEGDYAALTVSDTGMGIPAENREKIFEPFYTKKAMGRSGTGLGLAIVWGTVKDHNGYIDVQTEVEKGTTFTLYFPVTREKLIAQQQKAPIERYMGKGESVLVVDDIAEQRDVAAGLLTKLGYEVHVVTSGEEAVEYLRVNKADILVLDMIMVPGMDGLETYQRILEVNPKQKAIIVSGFSETERVSEVQKLGAGAYVKKPYMMEKIGVAIRDELNR